MKLRACAKVNLTLEVIGKRPDGYHEVRSIMQMVEVCDELEIEPGPGLELACDDAGLGGEDNLVLKTATLLQRLSGSDAGAAITLRKRIPEAAGMGGGSSDAAAALFGLNELWKTGFDRSALMSAAAQLGSDVPFFLDGPTAMVSGRGELISPLRRLPETWFVFAKPAVEIERKTARLYGMLAPADYTSGTATLSLAETLSRGQRPANSAFMNVFDRVLLAGFPDVKAAWDALQGQGAAAVHVCGSGPTVFGVFPEREDAERAALLISGGSLEVIATRSLQVSPLPLSPDDRATDRRPPD
jgi:4-diphosphocytidyl-2-C-methyl-D-erythritol kinase